MSTNFGKANVKVELVDFLPNVHENRTTHNIDITAHAWTIIQNSPNFSPLLSENIVDPLNSFSAIYPSRRKSWVDNFITDGSGRLATGTTVGTLPGTNLPSPHILWTPIGGKISTLTGTAIVKDLVSVGKFDEYDLRFPGNYPTEAGKYIGPKWEDDAQDREPRPDDRATIEEWLNFITGATSTTTSDAEADTTITLPKVNYISQTVTRDGLYWGVESNDFLNENMPFWITIKRKKSPSTDIHETSIIISLGIGSTDQAYDLYLSSNKKARLIDYYQGRKSLTTTTAAPTNEIEFDNDFAKMLESNPEIEIGFMTIGGRLIIFIDGNILVYTRIIKATGIDNDGTLAEVKIAPGKMRIWGTNAQTAINVSPMTFADLGILALPVPTIPPTIDPETGQSGAAPPYRNINNDGTIGEESVARLPNNPDDPDKLYGVDCLQFNQADPDGDSTNSRPIGFGFHKEGVVTFASAANLGFSALADTGFYVLVMVPSDTAVTFTGTSYTMRNGGTPYFFRLKGGAITGPISPGISSRDISEDVISVNESWQAPDYFSVKGSASVTLYNKGGKFDFLKTEQQGIKISFGWNQDIVKTFTGLTISANTSETAGRETIEVTCEDYSYILSHTPIVNSPFYDGMVMFFAVKDMVNRAGIRNVINDWDNTDDYFLPSGYAFTKPAVRFKGTMMLWECIMDVIKRGEAFIFFDEEGDCHVKKLPGGLFSVGAGEDIVATFTRDPAGPNTILDEKHVENTLESTVNRISLLTVDRNTRNAIIHTKSAVGDENRLKFRKVMMIDQPALGEVEVAIAWTEDLSKRVFAPIRKISFRTVGSDSIVRPLDFIDVDGEEYRLLSINRKYSAESNDFTNEYNAEWLGG